MKLRNLAMASGIAISAFLIAAPAMAQASGDRVDANGMPTTHSTSAEKAQTADLNSQLGVTNQAGVTNQVADAQAQADQEKYQAQQQQYQAAQQKFQDQTAAYEGLRARYAAERAAYHRGIWPDRYVHWTLAQSDQGLIGQRVEIINGDRVGTVHDVARTPGGAVTALLVQLDSDKVVWIDASDIRYDRADRVILTNLDRADLRHMADERL
jgi:hypothetical protein